MTLYETDGETGRPKILHDGPASRLGARIDPDGKHPIVLELGATGLAFSIAEACDIVQVLTEMIDGHINLSTSGRAAHRRLCGDEEARFYVEGIGGEAYARKDGKG